eukprot:TRINITY_DN55885_c0_g1_i1.p1 TRINITY_DN55885_c0_g1~~TRINITY_DN55885_c0_g1_i1.p1  ORF type:complete len:699 (+),score=399.30 TRINITY_DN55885_c0_g1_i1:49-2145(+)
MRQQHKALALLVLVMLDLMVGNVVAVSMAQRRNLRSRIDQREQEQSSSGNNNDGPTKIEDEEDPDGPITDEEIRRAEDAVSAAEQEWFARHPGWYAEHKGDLISEMAASWPTTLASLGVLKIVPILKPKTYSKQDLKDAIRDSGEKVASPLGNAELFVLHYTNYQILTGGKDVYLRHNLVDPRIMHAPKPKMYSEKEAAQLDGNDILTPLEKAAMERANLLLVRGDPDRQLMRQEYEILGHQYDLNPKGAAHDAKLLCDAMHGLTTDEDKIFEVLRARSKVEIKYIEQHFEAYARGHVKCKKDRGLVKLAVKTPKSTLQQWLESELSFGDEEKALDMLKCRKQMGDHDYYWSSAAGKWLNAFLKDSDSNAKAMIKHGNFVEKGIGHFNQWIFGSTKWVNDVVETSTSYWSDAIVKSEGIERYALYVPFVFASIGGAFVAPLKALDPTLTPEDTREGLIELSVLLCTFGVGKIISTGAKTAWGVKAVSKIAGQGRRVMTYMFMMRGASAILPKIAKYRSKAQLWSKLAVKLAKKHPDRARAAHSAARRLNRASRQAYYATQAMKKYKGAQRALEAAMKKGDIDPKVLGHLMKQVNEKGKQVEHLVSRMNKMTLVAARSEQMARAYLAFPIAGALTNTIVKTYPKVVAELGKNVVHEALEEGTQNVIKSHVAWSAEHAAQTVGGSRREFLQHIQPKRGSS